MDNPSRTLDLLAFAFLSWFLAIVLFVLMWLCRFVYWKYKKCKWIASLGAVFFSITCFVLCLISIKNLMKYLHLISKVSTWDLYAIMVIVIPDVLMLIISAIVCVMSFRNLLQGRKWQQGNEDIK